MSKNLKHHLATALAFAFLVLWYYVLQHFQFFDYMTELMPLEYKGTGLMLGIGLGMTPAFFIWSRFNRWAEKKLDIKGMYYEDSFYSEKTKK
ncbi:MAG: hypothetical protein V7784_10455 [Oceanospirillaceae bacterium]